MAILPLATTVKLPPTMALLTELLPTTTTMETVEPTSTATHTPAKLRPLQLPNTTTTTHQDLPLAPPLSPATPEAQDPPTTLTTTLTAEVTQDPPLRQTPPTVQVAATPDLLTATHHPAVLPTAQVTEAIAVAHTQDLQAAHLPAHPVLPAAIQDPPTVLPAAQAAEVAAHTQDPLPAVLPVHPAEAIQAPAAQDQAEAAIQEAVTPEAVHLEAPIQAVEVQEEAPLQAEDKFRIRNTKSNIQKHLTSRCFFYWHIRTLTH